MPIPALDAHGLLPVGTHDCTLDEMVDAFCWNAHRVELVDRLRDFLAQRWVPLGVNGSLLIDGSFTRKKDTPEDIDLVADIAQLDDVAALPAIRLWLQRTNLKADYKVDFWIKHPLFPNDLTEFFCYAGAKAAAELGIDSKQIKGILRITL